VAPLHGKTTHLGSVANPVDGLNWGSATYFVGVTVQGTELSPRTELTFAPYSLGSPKAQEVICSGAVGDVKYSILNPTQFAAVNGSCWVPLKGGSIAGSKLATITGNPNLPDVGGLFIRSQEFPGGANQDPDRDTNSPIANFQDQSFLSHTHTLSINYGGSHYHLLYLPQDRSPADGDGGSNSFPDGQGSDGTGYFGSTSTEGNHNHTGTNANTGGTETRPKNLNLWTYIRIN
jgi:hypothetical protein